MSRAFEARILRHRAPNGAAPSSHGDDADANPARSGHGCHRGGQRGPSPAPTPPLAATRLPVDRMAFTALARASQAWVAGELGAIVWSADDGKTWTEAVVEPRRHALVTEIVFVDARVGMAVSHEGQIPAHRRRRPPLEGAGLRQRARRAADEHRAAASGRWLAVGAFGRALASDDDGRQWAKVTLPGVEDQHLNRIVAAADGQRWLILGERGLVLNRTTPRPAGRWCRPSGNGSLYGAASNAWRRLAGLRHALAMPSAPAPTRGSGRAARCRRRSRCWGMCVGRMARCGWWARAACCAAPTPVPASPSPAPAAAPLTAIGLTADGQWLLASDLNRAAPHRSSRHPGPGTARAASPAPATSGPVHEPSRRQRLARRQGPGAHPARKRIVDQIARWLITRRRPLGLVFLLLTLALGASALPGCTWIRASTS